jgi:hypothetical protein
VGDERVGPQHRFQPLASVASLIAEFLELGNVSGDLTFVPSEQGCFDLREGCVPGRVYELTGAGSSLEDDGYDEIRKNQGAGQPG